MQPCSLDERSNAMKQKVTMRCVNCGTEWEPATYRDNADDHQPLDPVCPVCQFPVSLTAAPPSLPLSSDDFVSRLDALVSEARFSGLSLEKIANVLRDELEFVAEMANPGHRIHVQVIDLGPAENGILYMPVHDRNLVLQRRTA